MPVEHVLSATAIPVELHLLPQGVDTVNHPFFRLNLRVHILPCAQQALHQERALHQITAIILLAERCYPAGRIEPVRPHAVKTFGACEERDNLLQPCNALFTRDELSIHCHYYTGYTEARTSGGDDGRVVVTIVAINMDTLIRHACRRIGTVPHIIEVRALQGIHQRLIGQHLRCDGLGWRDGRLRAACTQQRTCQCQNTDKLGRHLPKISNL